jgi:hypothetical protein
MSVQADLPFDFTFYEMTFNRVNISTFDAVVKFASDVSDVDTQGPIL